MGNRSRRPNPVHDPVYGTLRVQLKAIREDAGLTQTELGDAFERNHSFIHKVEAGDRRIDPVEFCRWCLACKMDPAEAIAELSRVVKRSKPHR